MATKDVLK